MNFLAKIIFYQAALLLVAVATYTVLRRRGRSQLVGAVAVVVTTVLGLAPVWWTFFFNPLPSDEVMIANFKAHRADFEYLVNQYRGFVAQPGVDASVTWNKPTSVREAMKRAGVHRMNSVGALWLPNPYSTESLKAREALSTSADMKEKGFGILYPYTGINISLEPYRDYVGRRLFVHPVIFKNLYHIPQAPLVKDGKLYWPLAHDGSLSSSRLLNSLNGYPPDWKRSECVYRRIEEKWFISMCVGTP